MADQALNEGSDTAKLAEAEQIRSYARVAQTCDSILNDVEAVLHAIDAGGLFDTLPADETAHADHNAGSILLAGLGDRVRQAQGVIDDTPGTDLFIYLGCRARELTNG